MLIMEALPRQPRNYYHNLLRVLSTLEFWKGTGVRVEQQSGDEQTPFPSWQSWGAGEAWEGISNPSLPLRAPEGFQGGSWCLSHPHTPLLSLCRDAVTACQGGIPSNLQHIRTCPCHGRALGVPGEQHWGLNIDNNPAWHVPHGTAKQSAKPTWE